MRLPPPTVRQLEIFLGIVAEGSFRACAKALGVSQVAVSDAIRQMEKRFGQPLFYRHVGGASTLTPAGTRCHAYALRITAECDAMMAAMSLAVPEATERSPQAEPVLPTRIADVPQAVPQSDLKPAEAAITIAMHPSVFSHFREGLADFERAHPDTTLALDLDIFTQQAVAEAFARDQVDIACFYAMGDSLAFPSDYLWSEKLSLFVGEAHPLAQQASVGLHDLALVQPVHFGPRNRLRALISAALDAAGLGAAPVALESDDYGTILAHLRSGTGFVALFGPLARDFGQMDGIYRLPYADYLPAMDVRRAIRPARRGDMVMESLALMLG